MTKNEALKLLKKIKKEGLDRDKISSYVPSDSGLTVGEWNHPLFAYGLEWGVIIGIIRAFNINEDEI